MITLSILRFIRVIRADIREVQSTVRNRYPKLRNDWAW
jgi:hypothetical protein